MSNAKASIIIPTFDRTDYLAECLDSLLRQTLPPYEIIVVNDGSTDHTRQVLRPYSEKIIYLETNQLGKGGALNQGIERATGDYTWCFDDDDVALSDALARLVAPLEQNPDYGYSFCAFFYTETEEGSHRIGQVIGEFKIPDLSERGPLIPLLEANYLCGAGLFLRRQCFGKTGLFDTQLIRSQDYDLAIRAARCFKGVLIKGGPAFHYRQHEGMRGSQKDRFQAVLQKSKWLEYDQIIFRKVFRDLPLSDFLPPGYNLQDHKRQALLQRIAIMSSKLLVPEVLMDLETLSSITDTRPFSKDEKSIIRRWITKPPYYRIGEIFDCDEFLAALRRLSRNSLLIRRLEHAILIDAVNKSFSHL